MPFHHMKWSPLKLQKSRQRFLKMIYGIEFGNKKAMYFLTCLELYVRQRWCNSPKLHRNELSEVEVARWALNTTQLPYPAGWVLADTEHAFHAGFKYPGPTGLCMFAVGKMIQVVLAWYLEVNTVVQCASLIAL